MSIYQYFFIYSSWLPPPTPANTLYSDIVFIDANGAAASEQSKSHISRGKITDILILSNLLQGSPTLLPFLSPSYVFARQQTNLAPIALYT